MNLSEENIKELYSKIEIEWKASLEKLGVKMPSLKKGYSFTKDALVLVYLYKNLGKVVTKEELTSFIKKYHPKTNDVQQARHLGAQKGWNIISGTRHDVEAEKRNMKSGEYMLISLKNSYPGFTLSRRVSGEGASDVWEKIKQAYEYRCATCGSKEGEPNMHYPSSITHLQQGHMDPNGDMVEGNIIPQCEKCNRPDRNYFVYDKKGRVVKIADPKFILKSDKKVQKEVLEILRRNFP